jgi:hypothetical protein
MKKWKRKCPKCGEVISYSSEYSKIRAEKRNTGCISCSKKGKNNPNFGLKRSNETRKRMSESKLGDKNPNYGKNFSNEIRKNMSEVKFGKNNGMYGKTPWNKGKTNVYSEETRKDMSESKKGKNNPFYGKFGAEHPKYKKKCSDGARKKMRLSRIKVIERLHGQISPNYNPKAIPIIKEYEKKHGFNFQHAENGGEVCIGGYYPDGLDEKRKTIIEIDEKHHFDNSGKLSQKDIRRQRYLEGLGYEFIRVKV